MVRMQIQLTERQRDELHRIADERRVSAASLVRESLDAMLAGDDRARRWERAFAVVGRFRDVEGATDVACEHDRYLDEAWGH